jgi:hypothetical protein
VRRGLPLHPWSAIGLPQHADEHRPKDPVLLALDQELGEGATLRVAQNSPIRSARSKSAEDSAIMQSLMNAGHADRLEFMG